MAAQVASALRIFISAAFADPHDFDSLGNKPESRGILDGRALRGIQVELEFHDVAATRQMMCWCPGLSTTGSKCACSSSNR